MAAVAVFGIFGLGKVKNGLVASSVILLELLQPLAHGKQGALFGSEAVPAWSVMVASPGTVTLCACGRHLQSAAMALTVLTDKDATRDSSECCGIGRIAGMWPLEWVVVVSVE